jgi:hypothetical protein
VLRLFELGRKKLLRKCEYRQLPQHVAQLHALGSRIYVADVQVGGAGGWGCMLVSCHCRQQLVGGLRYRVVAGSSSSSSSSSCVLGGLYLWLVFA